MANINTRPFSYNTTGSPVSGTDQVGDLAIGTPIDGFEATGLQWWNGPNEELGYVISLPVPLKNQDTPVPGDDLILDPNFKATDISLSNNNQTATQVFSYQQSVLGSAVIAGNEKVMFSIKFTSTQPSVGIGGRVIGVGRPVMNYNSNMGAYPGNDNQSIGFSDDGQYYYNGTGTTGYPLWGDGDIIDIAVSSDPTSQGIWIRVNGGNWNNNPSANPTTNTGGASLNGVSDFHPVLCPYIYGTMEVLNTPNYGYPDNYNFLGNTTAAVKFYRSSALTDTSFKELVNSRFNQNFLTAQACKDYLTANDLWTSWGSLPAGMVLYLDAGITSSYPGSGSTWYDLSGNGNHGTINGATYSSSQGGILGFDGVNDYISFNTVSNIPIGNDNYTVSIWFNTTSSNTTGGFFGWGNYGTTNQVNAFRLLANGTGFVNYWWANDQNFLTTVNPDTWYNVIAKFDGANREIWLNGTLVGSVAPSPGHNVPFANNLTIGLTAPFLNEYFPGKIGQVVFYRRGATDQEIQDIYNSGASRFINNNPPPQSGFLITITNNGSNVLMTGTGSVNLTDLTLVATNQGPAMGGGIGINTATFIIGANGQNYDEYSGFLTVPSNFGSGSGLPPSSVSGSLFGIIYQGAPPHHLMVPTGYTSGTQLTTSQTFNNTSLASLGLTVGTYIYTWGTGPNADSVTVVIA